MFFKVFWAFVDFVVKAGQESTSLQIILIIIHISEIPRWSYFFLDVWFESQTLKQVFFKLAHQILVGDGKLLAATFWNLGISIIWCPNRQQVSNRCTWLPTRSTWNSAFFNDKSGNKSALTYTNYIDAFSFVEFVIFLQLRACCLSLLFDRCEHSGLIAFHRLLEAFFKFGNEIDVSLVGTFWTHASIYYCWKIAGVLFHKLTLHLWALIYVDCRKRSQE